MRETRQEKKKRRYFYEDGKESKVERERNAGRGFYASNAFRLIARIMAEWAIYADFL